MNLLLCFSMFHVPKWDICASNSHNFGPWIIPHRYKYVVFLLSVDLYKGLNVCIRHITTETNKLVCICSLFITFINKCRSSHRIRARWIYCIEPGSRKIACSATMSHSLAMMTSSNGNIFHVTGPLCGEFTWSPGNSPHKGPVTLSFDVFFDLHLNERLSTQSWGRWFETPSRSL